MISRRGTVSHKGTMSDSSRAHKNNHQPINSRQETSFFGGFLLNWYHSVKNSSQAGESLTPEKTGTMLPGWLRLGRSVPGSPHFYRARMVKITIITIRLSSSWELSKTGKAIYEPDDLVKRNATRLRREI